MAGKTRERGQITKRGPQKYLIRVYLGRIDGKRKYASKLVEGSKKKADAYLVKWLREMDTEVFVAPQDTPRFHEVALQWLASNREVERRTRIGYERNLHKHILPQIGYLKLNQIALPRLQSLFNDLRDRGYAAGSLAAYRNIVSMVFSYARLAGYTVLDPCKGLKLPKQRTSGGSTLSPEETSRVLKGSVGTRYHALWALLLGTGLRPQEACALQWGDLDFEASTVTLQRVLRDWETRKTLQVADYGKTEGSLGKLNVPKGVLRVLEGHRQEQLRDSLRRGYRTDWVFATRTGEPPLINNVRAMWKAACKKAGVPIVRLYDTRHTHATQLLEAGVHMKVIQGRLRHSSIATTMNTYSHLSGEMDSKAADVFDSLQKDASDKLQEAAGGL